MMYKTEDLIAGVIKIPTGFSEGVGKLITLSQPHSNWVITFDLLKPPQTSGHCVQVTLSHTVRLPCALLDSAKPQPEVVEAFWWRAAFPLPIASLEQAFFSLAKETPSFFTQTSSNQSKLGCLDISQILLKNLSMIRASAFVQIYLSMKRLLQRFFIFFFKKK